MSAPNSIARRLTSAPVCPHSSPCHIQQQRSNRASLCAPHPYKSVVIILVWTMIINGLHPSAMFATHYGMSVLSESSVRLVQFLLAVYMLLAIAMMFYPLSGFLADVKFGRYKVILTSLIILLACMIIVVFGMVLVYNLGHKSAGAKAAFVIGSLVAFMLLVVGMSGFISNIVPFGLDQLLDVPCQRLGAFVHWFVWASRVGQAAIEIIYTLKQCTPHEQPVNETISQIITYILPSFFAIFLIILLLVNYCTNQIFNKEKIKYNPYKMIVKVLNFARKHRYPVRHPSAFTYCDDTIPSRIDFAKERYGGPFTTSDVEDVKTFVRVFFVLLSLGPVFMINVSTSVYIFSIFSLHSQTEGYFVNCTANWILLESGSLSNILSIVFLPLYIWLVYSLLQNRVPKILVRLVLAVVLYILAILSMLVVDLIGHIVLHAEGDQNVMCMFVQPIYYYNRKHFKTLNLHWAFLIVPNVLRTLAPDLIMATALEFISAQSPHTMKGVLVGVLFAIRGFFQLFGAILLFPFSLEQIWRDPNLVKDPPVTSCGFGYFTMILAVSIVGLCLFVVAVKKYKYRKRDDEPYSQSRVEEIFSRRLDYEELRN